MAKANEAPKSGIGRPPQLDAHHLWQPNPAQLHRKVSASSNSSAGDAAKRKLGDSMSRPKAYSSSSRNTQGSSSTRAENRVTQRDVRTLPPWIDSYEEGDQVLNTQVTAHLLSSPNRTHAAQHHYAPTTPTRRISQDGFVDDFDENSASARQRKHETNFFGGHKEPEKGRKWDYAREGDPVIMQSTLEASPWRTYVKSSMYGPALHEDGTLVDERALEEQAPGYQKPWRGDLEGGSDNEKLSGLLHSKKRQKTLINRFQHTLLMHPLVPLVFRVTIFITSIIALGLAASIHHLSNKYLYLQNPSTTMAVVVDVVAIPYILYITWDEYTGKPLGLRAPKAKIRLVLIDLWFIIFESANLALAFAALTDSDGACTVGPQSGYNYIICDRIKALCGILMLALIAWSTTFSVSIFRLVERVGGREDND